MVNAASAPSYWYDDFEAQINKSVLVENPVVGLVGQFSSEYHEGGTTYLLSSDGSNIIMYTSSDGLTVDGGPSTILDNGGALKWDQTIYLAPRVWKEDHTIDGHTYHYMMIYGAYNGGNYTTVGVQTGLAMADDIIGPWVKYSANPIVTNINTTWGVGAEPWGLIKSGNTYYLWVNNLHNNMGTMQRNLTIATSTDLMSWTLIRDGPIFNAQSFCPFTVKYDGKFYVMVIHQVSATDYAQLDMYESGDPTFIKRSYVGTVYFTPRYNNTYAGDSDTPHAVVDDITNTVSDNFRVYHASINQTTDVWQTGLFTLSMSDALANKILPEPYVNTLITKTTSQIDLYNADVAHSGTKSAKIPVNALAEHLKFDVHQNNGSIDLWFQQTNNGILYLYLYNNRSEDTTFYLLKLKLSNGAVAYNNGTTADISLGSGLYTYNAWYNLKITYNGTTATYTASLYNSTGALKTTVTTDYMSSKHAQAEYLDLYRSANPTGIFYLDDINITNEVNSYVEPETPPSFTITTDHTTIQESDTTITLTVTKNASKNQTYNVTIATTAGTASSPDDYTALNEVLSFNNTTNSQTVVLSIKYAPYTNLSSKSFMVELSNPTGNATLGEPHNLTIVLNYTGAQSSNRETKSSIITLIIIVILSIAAMIIGAGAMIKDAIEKGKMQEALYYSIGLIVFLMVIGLIFGDQISIMIRTFGI
jgi:hypothetical protein